VCVFYLILRGLDTIEDNTSISLETKDPLFRDFKEYLELDEWRFTANRPEEKDRQLLVQFHNVVAEFRKLRPVYRAIIKDVTNEMGYSMVDFAQKAAFGDTSVNTVEEYELYCWYVGGVVGEGLTRSSCEPRLGKESLVKQSHLHELMGLLLQKN
jgi:farnesyl-diphosphate farnesyltransferase